ncbi:protein HIRA/HIR1 [Nematocida sp. AWRm80]|nr:protein HIRA/HIR1 [Nematocida sp. AWRm80]
MKVILTCAQHIQNKKPSTIFSVDIYPTDSTLIATAGVDGMIKIWKILEKETSLETSVQRHLGAVLCIRFSPNGEYLASGSDDGSVILWGVEKSNKIALKMIKKISNHRSDVSSIAWSEKYLVTGGYDGAVMVYDTKEFNHLRKLDKHEKGCKGVSFSPQGIYLATYGDEGELFLYDKDLKRIASTKKPFKGVQMESFFSRMSWSPDAKYLGCGLAFSDKKEAVAILSASLSKEYTLVGHSTAVEAVAFNKLVWTKNNKTQYILATGGQDRTIAIWESNSPKPLILLKDISEQPIMDLQWSSDGLSLVGCGYDGSLFVVLFTAEDLGTPSIPEIDHGPILMYSSTIQNTKDQEKERDTKPFPSPDKENPTLKPLEDQPNKQTEPPRKKIALRVIKPLESTEDKQAIKGERIILFTTPPPATTNQTLTECPIEIHTEDNQIRYRIQLDTPTRKTTVFREDKEWFELNGLAIKCICADKDILVICTHTNTIPDSFDNIWIYSLEKCKLLLPVQPCTLVSSIDVLERRVLVVQSLSFQVIDLSTGRTINGTIPSRANILNIKLDKAYFLVVLYETGAVIFYNPETGIWQTYSIAEPSIYSDTTVEGEPEECIGLEYLENRLLIGIQTKNREMMEDALRKIITSLSVSTDLPVTIINRLDSFIDEFLKHSRTEGLQFIQILLQKASVYQALQKYAYHKLQDLRLLCPGIQQITDT